MSNWKNNILFVLGIGASGHIIGMKLEHLTGTVLDPRVQGIVQDANNVFHQGTYHIEEGEKILYTDFHNSSPHSVSETISILNKALIEYKLAEFAYETAIQEFTIVQAKVGPIAERQEKDLEDMRGILKQVQKTIYDIQLALKNPESEFRIIYPNSGKLK